jgi:hypothetical protein
MSMGNNNVARRRRDRQHLRLPLCLSVLRQWCQEVGRLVMPRGLPPVPAHLAGKGDEELVSLRGDGLREAIAIAAGWTSATERLAHGCSQASETRNVSRPDIRALFLIAHPIYFGPAAVVMRPLPRRGPRVAQLHPRSVSPSPAFFCSMHPCGTVR